MVNKEECKKVWQKAYKNGFFIARESPSLVCQELSYYMELPGRVLDIGCGSGRNSMFFARMGYEVDAVDLIDAFPQAYKEHGLVSFYNKDIRDINFGKDKYLAIVATRFMHHLSGPTMQKLIKECYGAIKPNGYLTLSFAFSAEPFKKSHLPFFHHDPERIIDFAEKQGFGILIKKDINKVPTGVSRSQKKLGDSFEVIFVKK